MPLSEISLEGGRSRAEDLYEALRAAILDGRLLPGERLVEEAIAAIASVSRTPVREALRQLRVQGLVSDTGSGTVVVAFTLNELADMCLVRETLEGLAARQAAETRSDLDLMTMTEILDQWSEAETSADVDNLVALNHAFHELVWQVAGNRYLSDQLLMLRGLIERLQPTTLAVPGRAKEAGDEHRAVLDAIRERDAERAESLARQHFRKALALRLARERLRR